MKRKIMTIISLLLLFCMLFSIPTFATQDLRRLVDEAYLLSIEEVNRIEQKLDEASERQRVDIVIVTVESFPGRDIGLYAMDFYERHDYGMGANRDGVLLLVCISSRQFTIITYGYGSTAITDVGREFIEDQIVTYLGNGVYDRAFEVFVAHVEHFISQERAGTPVGGGRGSAEAFPLFWIPVAIVIGMIIAFIIVFGMRNSMKSVRQQRTACNYVRANSLRITRSKDIFLFRNIRRVPRAQNNNNRGSGTTLRTSSSGRSFGGGTGRRF